MRDETKPTSTVVLCLRFDSAAENPGVQRFFSSIRFGRRVSGIEVSDGEGDPLEIDGERIFTGREVEVKPKLLQKPEPQYTFEARKKSISGTVVLKAVFSSTGYVTNIRVISGLPEGDGGIHQGGKTD